MVGQGKLEAAGFLCAALLPTLLGMVRDLQSQYDRFHEWDETSGSDE